MAEHTPGPWYVSNGNHAFRIQSHAIDDPWHFVGVADEEPDARLIAAAPDLLEAAHAVLEVNDSEEPCDIPACKGCEAMSQLRVAVAKAEGR